MPEESKTTKVHLADDAITIREAKPNLDEGLRFAQYFNEASEGFFESMLGIKTFEIIADAFVKPNNEYSFENAWVVEYKNEIVGMISGYSQTEKKGFKKNILSQYQGGSKLRILMFSVTGKILSWFLGPRGKNDYYLQAIAINSQLRGKGLGQKLMQHAGEMAIKKGSKTLSLDVSSKNEKAIKSYLKFGMLEASHWPNILKLPPVFTRMVKEL